jgi:hypothetical protein
LETIVAFVKEKEKETIRATRELGVEMVMEDDGEDELSD